MATAASHVTSLASLNRDVAAWVDEVARLTRPAAGSTGATAAMPSISRSNASWWPSKELLALDQQSFPGCYLYRSHPSDVARVEHVTYVCTRNRDDAGPNNPWLPPDQAHAKMDALFAGCMQGRTLVRRPVLHGTDRFAVLSLRR